MLLSKSRLRTVKTIMSVVMFVLLFCSLILAYLIQTLRSDTFDNYQAMSTFVENSMDAQLQNIRRYSLFLELNTTSNDAARHTGSYDQVPDSLYKLSLDLMNYQSITSIVDDVFIYYPKSDFVIGNIGCFPSSSFFALYQGLKIDPTQAWIDAIVEAPLELSVLSFPKENSLCYIRRIGPDANPQGYIVFILNIENLLSSFSHTISPQVSTFQISLLADGIYLHKENKGTSVEKKLDTNKYPNTQTTIVNDNSLQIHVIPSNFANLFYINAYDLGESYRSLQFLLLLCIGGILLIGIGAFIFSLTLSATTNKPLQDLLLKIGAPSELGADEYDTINTRFDMLLDEKTYRIAKLQTQQDTIDSLFLLLLLSPSITSEDQAFRIAKQYGIMLQSQYMYLVVFSSQQDFTLLNYDALMAFFTEQGFECWASIREGKCILVLHCDETKTQQELSSLVGKARDTFLAPYPTKTVVASGTDNLMGIKKSYQSVLPALESCPFEGAPILFVKAEQLTDQLRKAFIEKDTSLLSRLLDSLFLKEKTIPKEQGDLFASIFNAFLVEQAIKYEVAPDTNGMYWKSSFLSTLPYCAKESTSVLKEDHHISIAQQAKDIIDSEYTDYFLGLYRLSEKLSVSNSYLSTTFKETFGVGVVQYINQLRIGLAKQMILSTDKNIKEIALEVGFSSDISFIRVFKRYESKTPGMLRK
jgi:AraC-like DNA-binding protein